MAEIVSMCDVGVAVFARPGLAWAVTSTAFNSVISTLPTGSITLRAPYGVAMDASGNFYISNGGGGSSGQATGSRSLARASPRIFC